MEINEKLFRLTTFFPPECVDTGEHNSSTAISYAPKEYKETRNSAE